MKKAYLDYIKYALASGYKVAVMVEEEIVLKSSDSYKKIKEEVEAYDAIVSLLVRDVAKKETIGWADVILDSAQGAEESILDYDINDHNNAWAKAYYQK